MTYTTPELLLVGAAKNLVLGDSPLGPCQGKDEFQGVQYNDTEDW